MASGAHIDQLTQAFETLRGALGRHDVTDISSATRQVQDAVDALRAEGLAPADTEIQARVADLVSLVEATRVHLNLASDDVRQRIALIADHGGDTARAVYRR